MDLVVTGKKYKDMRLDISYEYEYRNFSEVKVKDVTGAWYTLVNLQSNPHFDRFGGGFPLLCKGNITIYVQNVVAFKTTFKECIEKKYMYIRAYDGSDLFKIEQVLMHEKTLKEEHNIDV